MENVEFPLIVSFFLKLSTVDTVKISFTGSQFSTTPEEDGVSTVSPIR